MFAICGGLFQLTTICCQLTSPAFQPRFQNTPILFILFKDSNATKNTTKDTGELFYMLNLKHKLQHQLLSLYQHHSLKTYKIPYR